MKGTFLFREGTVSYTQKGKGRAVILLHGFMENKEIWNYYIEMLSPYFRVIAIDLPGHGATECYGYVHTMDLMADCVKAAMKHIKIRKAIIVGHSMGGYVSLAFAEKYPDNVAGICLFHSTANADSEQRKNDRDQAIRIIKKNVSTYINQAVPNLFFREHRSYGREIARMKSIAFKTPLQGIIANMEGMKIREDRNVILKFSPYPILFIAGKEDNIINYKDLVSQSKLPPHSYLQLLEDVGHMGFIEASDKCWVAILRFARSPYSFKPIV